MDTFVENINHIPSYNGYVITEPDDLTAALDQYWIRRKAFYAEKVERLKLLAHDAAAERVWREFCQSRTGFLPRLLKNGAAASELALQSQLRWKRGFAHHARVLFEKDARAEIWIPINRDPLRLVRTPGRQDDYDIVDYPDYDGKDLELGKPIVAIGWMHADLFLLLPSLEYVVLDTFEVTLDHTNWHTQEALPLSFLGKVAEFKAEWQDAERSFAGLRLFWETERQLATASRQLAGVDRAAALWERVHLPADQKLKLLRRIELFEDGDPGAPSGLLLTGPPGTGKTMIVATLAEALGCHRQLLSLPDFKSQDLGESAQWVRQKWNVALANQPSLLFVDDCEGVFVRRGSVEADKIGEEIVEAFLPESDGVKGRARILLIGATNRPDLLDDAMISRFGWKMEIGLPDAENRKEIFTQELSLAGITTDPPSNIGELTPGMSGRDLFHLAGSVKAISSSQEPTPAQFLEAISELRELRSTSVDERSSWDTLVLDDDTLSRLKLICTLLKEADKWRGHGISIPKSLLLIGPSGVGKTTVAKTLANESGLNFLAPSTAQVKAAVLGGSANQIRQLFERGRSMAPCIIFLDKLEIIAPKQSVFDAKDRLTEEVAGQVQLEMHGAASHKGDVFLMAATHNSDLVDENVLGSFQQKIVLPLPDRSLRSRLLTILLTGKKVGFALSSGSQLLADLVDSTNPSGGELRSWVDAAEQKALMRAIQDGGPEHLSIELEDFETFMSD